jgi:hypothetical protein
MTDNLELFVTRNRHSRFVPILLLSPELGWDVSKETMRTALKELGF